MDEDRVPDTYKPEFDIDIKRGKQGEMFVQDIVDAMSKGGHRIEIKRDDMSQVTGNIYVEYRCKRRGAWAPSGISTTEAQVWVFVLDLGNLAVCISTERLRGLVKEAHSRGRKAEEKDGSHPTKGVLVRLTDLVTAGTHARRGKHFATAPRGSTP